MPVLRQIKLREISFVDHGASGDADNRPRVALWKRRDQQRRQTMKFTAEIAKRVMTAIDLKKAGEPEAAQAVLDGIKSKLDEAEWAMVEMMIAGAAPLPAAPAKAEPDPELKPEPKPEEVEAAKRKATDELAASVAKALADKLNPQEADAITKLAKSQPEVAAVLVELQKRADAAEKAAKDATEKLEKSEKERLEDLRKSRIAKFEKLAETDLKYLQGKPEEIAKRLVDLEDVLEKDEFAKHVQMLKAASEQIAKAGTFKPTGAPGSEGGSAYDAIVSKARELQKTDPKLTDAQAKARVIKSAEHRDLVKRYREEQAAAH